MNNEGGVKRRCVIQRTTNLAVERQETTDDTEIPDLVHEEERSTGKPRLFLDDVDHDRKAMYTNDNR